jgi:hypothetical protein
MTNLARFVPLNSSYEIIPSETNLALLLPILNCDSLLSLAGRSKNSRFSYLASYGAGVNIDVLYRAENMQLPFFKEE